jgi:hypothetical protein
MKGSARLGLAVGLGIAGAAGAAVVFLACSGGDNPGKVPNQIINPLPEAGSYLGDAGAPCIGQAGTVANPECDNGTESLCAPSSPACDLSKCQETNTSAGSCGPMATNPPGGPWDFRMRRIMLVAPKTLATTTVQNSVVTNGVDMNELQCGETGTGDFSWLIHMDPDAGTVKTGGAPPCDIPDNTGLTTAPFPSCNPYTQGYCFLNQQVGSIAVGPISTGMAKNSEGTWDAPNIGSINIPIFYQNSIIILPINGGSVYGVKVSTDGNCIGQFNPLALNTQCSDQYLNCSKWLTDGTLTGYITLEQADQVDVLLLSRTLCVILENAAGVLPPDGGSISQCARDSSGHITGKGDYCSTTHSPGGCQDSFWLEATFAASAVKINGDCAGGDGG